MTQIIPKIDYLKQQFGKFNYKHNGITCSDDRRSEREAFPPFTLEIKDNFQVEI